MVSVRGARDFDDNVMVCVSGVFAFVVALMMIWKRVRGNFSGGVRKRGMKSSKMHWRPQKCTGEHKNALKSIKMQ